MKLISGILRFRVIPFMLLIAMGLLLWNDWVIYEYKEPRFYLTNHEYFLEGAGIDLDSIIQGGGYTMALFGLTFLSFVLSFFNRMPALSFSAAFCAWSIERYLERVEWIRNLSQDEPHILYLAGIDPATWRLPAATLINLGVGALLVGVVLLVLWHHPLKVSLFGNISQLLSSSRPAQKNED